MEKEKTEVKKPKQTLISFLMKYKVLVFSVIALSLLVNGLSIWLPKINASAIDSLQTGTYDKGQFLLFFGGVSTVILIAGLIQTVLSNITAEKVAAELRRQVIAKISRQTYKYVNEVSNAKLLTNLTADTDAVKNFVNLGMVIAFAAVVQLIGSAVLLLVINWQLAIPVILTIPFLMGFFGFIFKSLEKYFVEAQKVIDRLNATINESIVGSALIRVLTSKKYELNKFSNVNKDARFNGIKMVNGFAILFPVITLVVNFSFLVILGFGGFKVIDGTLSAGNFAAFFSYIFLFITPVFMLGFLSNEVQRAFVTYGRIHEVIDSDEPKQGGDLVKTIDGSINVNKLNYSINEKKILNDVTFDIKPNTRVAIIGPTAAGKSQLFYLLTGLTIPSEGEITIDGEPILEYDTQSLYSQIGMVFQDSMIFNTSVRENISFKSEISEEQIWKALETAELKTFVEGLPKGLDTVVSERGSSLSGGQKQRLTLARALALDPKILLLDDFTARVDQNTEKRILDNIEKNYPNITIISITQKIKSIENFDKVMLLMEGELLATGTHEELLKNSLEYQMIFNSQQQVE